MKLESFTAGAGKGAEKVVPHSDRRLDLSPESTREENIDLAAGMLADEARHMMLKGRISDPDEVWNQFVTDLADKTAEMLESFGLSKDDYLKVWGMAQDKLRSAAH